jgi:hypothetical protein
MIGCIGKHKLWSYMKTSSTLNLAVQHVVDHDLWHTITRPLRLLEETAGMYKNPCIHTAHTDPPTSSYRRGRLRWYINIVTDDTNDEYLKTYISHATVMLVRAHTHVIERSRPYNDTSFHYFVATKPERESFLGTPGMDDEIITDFCKTHPPQHPLPLEPFVKHYLCCLFQSEPERCMKF